MKKLPLVMMLAASVYAVSGTVAYADDNDAAAQPASAAELPLPLPTSTLNFPTTGPEVSMLRPIYRQLVLNKSVDNQGKDKQIFSIIRKYVSYEPLGAFEGQLNQYISALEKLNPEYAEAVNKDIEAYAKIPVTDEEVNNAVDKIFSNPEELHNILVSSAKAAFPNDPSMQEQWVKSALADQQALRKMFTDQAKEQLQKAAPVIRRLTDWNNAIIQSVDPLAAMDLDVYHRIQAHARQYALQHALMDRDVEIADSLSMSSAAGLKYANSRNGILKTTLPGAFGSFSAGMANLSAFITVNPHYQSVCRSDCFKFTGNSIGLGVASSYAFAPQSHLTGLLALRYHRVKTDGADSVRQNGFEADLLLKADHTFGTGPVTATTDAHYQVDYMRFSKHGAKTLTQKAGVGLDANFAIASQFKVGAVLGLNYVHNKQPKFASFWLLPEAAKTPWLNVFKKSDWQSRVGVQAQYNALKNLSVQAGVYHDTYYGAGMNANSYQLDVNYQF